MGNTHPSGDPENKMEILLIFESFVFLVWCTQDSHNLIDTQRDEGKNSSQLKGDDYVAWTPLGSQKDQGFRIMEPSPRILAE